MKIYLFLILLYSTKLFSNGEEIHYHKIIQKINILNESYGYTKQITCKGVFLNKLDKSISIVSNELEKLENFKNIGFISNKAIQKDIEINENTVATESFYDGLKEYSIQYFDTSMAFGLQYDVSCKHLILLSTFPLVEYPNVDTLIYEIKSPVNFYLKFKSDTSLHFFTIDTTFTDYNFKTYRIISIPKRKIDIKKSFHSMYEINRFVNPSLRVIVISAGGNDEWKYFNNWFNMLIKDNVKLKAQSLKAITPIINGNETEEEIIKKVFEYINTNIKYVAFENGLEGFRPRDVNSILLNKYGDCKDMANVLCQILRYYNLNASIAVIGTIDYPYQIDFPSLASANHAICIVKTKVGKTFYLDATNKTGTYYLPSQFIQGQYYFAFNDRGGEKNRVPIMSSDRNRSNSFFSMMVYKTSLSGTNKNDYLNYSGSMIKHFTRNSTESDAKISISKSFNQLNSTIKFTNIKTNVIDSIVTVNSDVVINNVVNKIDNKNFLLLKFLVFPHQYPKKIKEEFSLITYQTNDSHFFYEINFNDAIKVISKLNDFHFNNEYLSFDLNFKIKDEKTLIIEYYYKLNKIELKNDEIKVYEKLNVDIIKIFNTSIEYEINK